MYNNNIKLKNNLLIRANKLRRYFLTPSGRVSFNDIFPVIPFTIFRIIKSKNSKIRQKRLAFNILVKEKKPKTYASYMVRMCHTRPQVVKTVSSVPENRKFFTTSKKVKIL